MRETLVGLPGAELSGAWVRGQLAHTGLRLAPDLALMILGMGAIGVAVTLAQTGPMWAGKRLGLDLSRLNPMAGLGRLFSGRGLMELARALLKLGVVGWAAYSYLRAQWEPLLLLGQTGLAAAVTGWSELALGLGLRVGSAYLALAAADYGYQRWSLMRSLRMTREEIKEDLKSTEGDPLLRGRIRQQQRRIARQRMLSRVPKADVVITNPTHFAVALQYDRHSMPAPRLVAKGAGSLAQRINDAAREHHVAIVENPPLGRGLYRSVEVDQEVPPELYVAVAEVLAFVYSLKAGRQRPALAAPAAQEEAPTR
jgi:flagellar biosynthetic protein FlhB